MGSAWQIPLSVNQPTFTTPGQAMTQGLNLKQLAGQVAIQKQVQDENALKIQAQQEDQRDQQTIQDAFHNNPHDFDKVVEEATPKIRLRNLQALQKEHQTHIDTLAKIPDTKRKEIENKNTAIGNALMGVLQTPVEGRPAAAASAKQELVKNGVIDANDPAYADDAPLDDQSIKAHLAHVGYATQVSKLASDQIESEAKKASTSETLQKLSNLKTVAASTLLAGALQSPEKYSAKLAQIDKDTGTKFPDVSELFDANGKLLPDATAKIQNIGRSPQEQVVSQQTAAQLARQAAADEETKRYHKAETAIQSARLNLERERSGFEMGGGISATAKAAANGDLNPSTVRAMLRKNPGLINQIKQVDPDFDEASIEKRYSTLKEFTSTSTGKAGGQALALNTLIHHADLYQEVADSLKNGKFTPGNAVYNKVAEMFGSAPPTNTALVARFLAGETGKVATGGIPAEGEINGLLKSLSTSASPDQIKQAGDNMLRIAGGRAVPLMERVDDAKLGNVVHVLGKDAQSILQKRGLDPRTMKPITAKAKTASASPQVGDIQEHAGSKYRFDGTQYVKQP